MTTPTPYKIEQIFCILPAFFPDVKPPPQLDEEPNRSHPQKGTAVHPRDESLGLSRSAFCNALRNVFETSVCYARARHVCLPTRSADRAAASSRRIIFEQRRGVCHRLLFQHQDS